MPRGPMRKPFIPPGAGPGMAASAVGGPMDGMTAPPQVGRMNAQPPMPMAGNNQPQLDLGMGMPMGGPMGGPPMDPQMLGGGPTSPFQVGSMLEPQQQPPQAQPEGPPLTPQRSAGGGAADLPDAGEMGMGAPGQVDRTGPGNSMPMVMLRLMKAMGQLG